MIVDIKNKKKLNPNDITEETKDILNAFGRAIFIMKRKINTIESTHRLGIYSFIKDANDEINTENRK